MRGGQVEIIVGRDRAKRRLRSVFQIRLNIYIPNVGPVHHGAIRRQRKKNPYSRARRNRNKSAPIHFYSRSTLPPICTTACASKWIGAASRSSLLPACSSLAEAERYTRMSIGETREITH